MQYTPQQVMATIGLSQQTLRYWRNALPPLAGRDGYTACFTFSDLLALKVTYLLAHDVGIAIGTIAKMSQALFDACQLHSPLTIGANTILVVCPRTGRVARPNRGEERAFEEVEIVVPLRRCVDELLQTLQAGDGEPTQTSLPLPLAAVSGRGRRP